MTAIDFSDLQEFFIVVFVPILQWLFVGIAASAIGLLMLVTGLSLLRRMAATDLGDRPNP